jgi:hypothetical protein
MVLGKVERSISEEISTIHRGEQKALVSSEQLRLGVRRGGVEMTVRTTLSHASNILCNHLPVLLSV